jgi:hypothetical protein
MKVMAETMSGAVASETRILFIVPPKERRALRL